ncbi:NAD(P)-binding domain-containing protein [Patulibacter sp.]|uniref:NAD(P)-binding domain-containing protein n=1 Tax=Patulibacter sp. TaxID=1912859 RepID=UPI002726C47D|nr:NAD(P)-binding domain-containing protein [Patulibacter sp.]MDO9410646.1 NAD(P)-binding domain-containing protein [Patulibacter sp.]
MRDATEDQACRRATVVVVGAGQAGLSAGHHLVRRGFAAVPGAGDPVDATGAAPAAPDATFVVLDAEDGPGGAWRHRWASLTMRTVNGIFDLPRFPKPPIDPDAPSRDAVPEYFAAFERAEHLPIRRPVTVTAVTRADADPDGDLLVTTDAGRWRTRAVINATGTWNTPVLPAYPGRDTFRGRQLHTRDYVSADELAGRRVAIVGGGISAIQLLEEVSRVATVLWYTRREPVFRDGEFRPEVEGRMIIERVTADVEAGDPTGSVVSYTGQIWSASALAARERGVLHRRPMFASIEPDGVREPDGTLTPVDVLLWATGFKAHLPHLDPLGLRNDRGGIEMRGTRVADEPRVHLIGFGPSQSTVGANRAGRQAAWALAEHLGVPRPTGARPGR